MKFFFQTSVLTWILISILSCDLINPEEEIPGYVSIEPFQITTTSAQGSASAKISEVWVSAGNDFLGAYRFSQPFPVLGTGPQTLTLQAGIKDNGIGELPEIYPFYAPVTVTVDLNANEMQTIRPVTSYLPETKFAFIENFEGPLHIFRSVRTGTTAQAVQRSTEMPFEGQASGVFVLDSVNTVAEVVALPLLSGLNSSSPIVYLEMNYKSDVDVFVGLVGFETGGPAAGTTLYETGFRARADWNKIYFNLSRTIFDSRFPQYQIILQAAIPVQNGVPEKKVAKVWIDNVKLVHF
jgi:hypothetical protein